MKFQGQFITVKTPSDESGRGSFYETYGVSEQRNEEIKSAVEAHFLACKNDRHTDVKQFLEELPVDAQTYGEIALAAIFASQLLTQNHATHNSRTGGGTPFERMLAEFLAAD